MFIVKAIDRIKLNKVLQRLPSWQRDHLPLCRPPRCIITNDFGDEEELYRELSGAGEIHSALCQMKMGATTTSEYLALVLQFSRCLFERWTPLSLDMFSIPETEWFFVCIV